MQNLGIILRFMKSVAPGLDPQELGAEIRGRIEEELDYELEAQNQRTLARIYKGHPFIFIPDVYTSLSHERVIVSEFVTGRKFDEFKTCPEAERDRLGEIIFRFYFGSMYRHHRLRRRPTTGELPAAGRRPHGVPGLRVVQADLSRRSPSTSCRPSAWASTARARS